MGRGVGTGGARPLPLQLGGMGERSKLIDWGLGRSPKALHVPRYEASEQHTRYRFQPQNAMASSAHAHVMQQLFNFHIIEFSTTRFDVRLTHSRSLSL